MSRIFKIVIFSICVSLSFLIGIIDATADYKTNQLSINKPISEKIGGFIYPYYQNESDVSTQVKALKNVGVKYARVPAEFSTKTMLNGSFEIKKLVDTVQKLQSVNIIPIIYFGSEGGAKFPANLNPDLVRSLVKEVVCKFANMGVIWESWNEPNELFWVSNKIEASTNSETIKSWVTMDKYIGSVIQRYDGNSPYIIGNFAGSLSDDRLTISIANEQGLFEVGDAISFHPYPLQRINNGRPENLSYTMEPSIIALDRRLPIVTTEIGYSRLKRTNFLNHGRLDYYFDWQGSWSTKEQGDYLVRSLLMLDSMKEPIICVFSTAYDNYSITDRSGNLNYAGKQLRNMLRQLSGYAYARDLLSNSMNSSQHALLYKDGTREKVVAWVSNGTARVTIYFGKGIKRSVCLTEKPKFFDLSSIQNEGRLKRYVLCGVVILASITLFILDKRIRR
ncbi:hypothetical protein CJP55_04025 [Lactobacillus plantarum]|nr:hypothetical protein [Lactiplantibacillus plantarum]